MRLALRCLLSSLVVGLLAACAHAVPPVPARQTIDPPAQILFVGNSFTYYNDSLHQHLRLLMLAGDVAAGQDMHLRAMTISGAPLPEHAAGLPSVLAAEPWDIVILQGHSKGPISKNTAPAFRQAARDYAALIRERSAEPVFFMTWAYTGEPWMTDALATAYIEIANELDALVVPVGLAFAHAGDKAPEIILRHADAKHPTLAGTYLAACVFYAALFNKSPVGLPYEAGLASEQAAALQTIAKQSVDRFYRR